MTAEFIRHIWLGGFGNTNITIVDELETEQIIDNFRIPTVPIIFVIGKKKKLSMERILKTFPFIISGGPGSGKITHCQRISTEVAGWEHICMTEVINQIIKSSGEAPSNDYEYFIKRSLKIPKPAKFCQPDRLLPHWCLW